eukprot:Em0015g76a
MPEDTNCWLSKKLNAVKKWVALEKVHGANFSFTVQRDCSVLVAKRGSVLTEKEDFFGVWRQKGLVDEEREKAKRVFLAAVRELKDALTAVTIYGELFGGHYPHPSVASCVGVVPVQRAVAYCPGLNFYAYDIAVIYEVGRREYLDYDMCAQLFQEAGFLYATPLCTGTLQQMLNYPLGFATTLPQRLGLPSLPCNVAEGIVVRPIRETVLMTATKGPSRVIFKRKVEQFAEKHSRVPPPELDKGKTYLADDAALMRVEMLALVTSQRVINTVSKYGLPDTSEGWTEITERMIQDVLAVLRDEQAPLWFEHESKCMDELRQECDITVQGYKQNCIMQA